MKEQIQLIPIDQIHILNPRHRDQKKFQIIIESIKTLGLKKPIQISKRTAQDEDASGYDLVCGQGRIEAFKALGYQEIPAIVVEVSKEDRLLRSLIENMARRFPVPADLLREIERLKTAGYSHTEIGKKLGIGDAMVSGFISLRKSGEERLLQAAITGKIPLSVAMDIARTEGVDAQRALLRAYEKKQMNQDSIRTVKRLIAHRRFLGKKQVGTPVNKDKTSYSAKSLVATYRREGERMKRLVKTARICQSKVEFTLAAINKLLADEKFRNVLKTESLTTIPKTLSDRINTNYLEAI